MRIGLRMPPHVDHHNARQLADLRGREADAALERSHRVEQVPPHGLGVRSLRGRRHLLQGPVRIDENFANGH